MSPILLFKEDLLIGSLVLFAFILFMVTMNFLRSDSRLLKIMMALISIFILELLLIKFEFVEKNYYDSINLILAPMVYTTSYFLLRKLFVYLYGMEPTYNRMSWFDHTEGRRQNGGDMVVFFIPMILGIVACLIFSS